MAKLSIAVFASGGGTNLQALIDASKAGTFRGTIQAVISNNSSAYALIRAKQENIPTYHISAKTHPNPDELADRILEIFQAHSINLVVLAGYMKLLPLRVVRAYRSRIINIHPALLPKYGGKGMYGINVHKAVNAAGDRTSGATVHFVDESYDQGPIIVQRTVPVYPGDSPEELAARVLKVEHKILPEAVSMFL